MASVHSRTGSVPRRTSASTSPPFLRKWKVSPDSLGPTSLLSWSATSMSNFFFVFQMAVPSSMTWRCDCLLAHSFSGENMSKFRFPKEMTLLTAERFALLLTQRTTAHASLCPFRRIDLFNIFLVAQFRGARRMATPDLSALIDHLH